MAAGLTWGEVYQGERRRVSGELLNARRHAQSLAYIGTRRINPSFMSDHEIEIAAIQEAERLTNNAINVEIEQARKAGRPADLN